MAALARLAEAEARAGLSEPVLDRTVLAHGYAAVGEAHPLLAGHAPCPTAWASPCPTRRRPTTRHHRTSTSESRLAACLAARLAAPRAVRPEGSAMR